MSLYGAVGPVHVGEIEIASHPEYVVSVSGRDVFDRVTHVVYVLLVTIWMSVYRGYYDMFVVVEVYFSGSHF